MNQDIVPADKSLRKRFIIFFILFTIAVILIAPYFNDYMEHIKQISKENPELAFKKSMFMLKLTLGIVSLLLLMTGVYFIILARRTFKSGQYPPPGMRVIRNTRLRTGTQAQRAAISLIVLSCILIILAFFFLYFPWAFEKTIGQKRHGNMKLKGKVTIITGAGRGPEKASAITLSGAVIGANQGDSRLRRPSAPGSPSVSRLILL
jgi:heme/copper-type cytochrome/quinol oxidase subunit 2